MSQRINTSGSGTPSEAPSGTPPEARPESPADSRPGPKAANAIPEERILDAAYQLLLTIGMQRITMADIARQAGVSRATLYRRWGGVREVLGALTTRVWTELAESAFESAFPLGGATHGRAHVVDGTVRLVGAIRVHPLLRKIIELDPDFLTPYLLKRRGTNTNHQLAMLEAGLRAGLADGSIRTGDPALLARAVLLTAWSFTLTGPVFVDAPDGAGDEVDRLDGELRLLLDRYLSPTPVTEGGSDA
ncbi:TetR/AcrR family transcriptional regulator [Kitasatospora sp. GAS204B]|uniref:TetR/AcrR family transcriptional regulator n=1 Tax=unclassified Kitasatospora TaxID=2633591 RepID=UPI0024765C55|nr:TetR/AcrR family transcriptional regulator [Kitasatospora sp. GAS204B]MDH6118426.1 AcrR family transcriptional regulator [Kitasatospora sp. GAS204B]